MSPYTVYALLFLLAFVAMLGAIWDWRETRKLAELNASAAGADGVLRDKDADVYRLYEAMRIVRGHENVLRALGPDATTMEQLVLALTDAKLASGYCAAPKPEEGDFGSDPHGATLDFTVRVADALDKKRNANTTDHAEFSMLRSRVLALSGQIEQRRFYIFMGLQFLTILALLIDKFPSKES